MNKRKRKRPTAPVPEVQQALVVLNRRYLENPLDWVADAIHRAAPSGDFPCEIQSESGADAKYVYIFFRTRWRAHRGISMLLCEDSEGVTTIFQAINERVETLTSEHCPISAEHWDTIEEIEWRVFAKFVSHLSEAAFTVVSQWIE